MASQCSAAPRHRSARALGSVNLHLIALACQVALLVYHQVTTLVDLHPFNGVRHYQRREKVIEAGVNAALMGTAIAGTVIGSGWMLGFAAVYYPVLFLMEIVIWWVPYFTQPAGKLRAVYNVGLALGTSDFSSGDTLSRWVAIYQRTHASTLTPLPRRAGLVVPNLEHIILHAGTALVVTVTLLYYFSK